jgi:hypothetical protein
MTDQVTFGGDLLFRAYELKKLSNATLAVIANAAVARRGGTGYWTGPAVQDHGRMDIVRLLLIEEGFHPNDVDRVLGTRP